MPAVPVPAVSVIVPVYRQWELVPGLLAALAGQEGGPAFELVLVDNAPGDAAGEARPTLDLPAWARIVPCAAPGSYAARNAGLAAARGGLLAFTDADCLPSPRWLAALAAAAGRHPGALLAGPVDLVAAMPPNRYEIYDLLRGIPQERYARQGYAATANLAVPAAVAARLGGFDAGRLSGADADLCRRAGRAGHPLRLVPEAGVAHPARASWPALATKARRVKGGQLTGGPRRARALWLLRTLTPPLRATARFLRAGRPPRDRLLGIAVLYRLWLVELAEAGRLLLLGRPPERR